MLLRARAQASRALSTCRDVLVLRPVRRSRPVLHRHQSCVDRLVSHGCDDPGIVPDGLYRLPRRVPRRLPSHHALLPHVSAFGPEFLQELLSVVVVETLRVHHFALWAVPLRTPDNPQRHAVYLSHHPPLPLPVALLACVLLVAVAGNKLARALDRVRGLEYIMAHRLVALQPASEAAVWAAEEDVGEDVAGVSWELTRELVVERDDLLEHNLRGSVNPHCALGKALRNGSLQLREVGLVAFRLAGAYVVHVAVRKRERSDLLVGGRGEPLDEVGGDITFQNFGVASLMEDDQGRSHRRHHSLHSCLDGDSFELGLTSGGCQKDEERGVVLG
eukprot:751499-Hanusia_phi.AAC.5